MYLTAFSRLSFSPIYSFFFFNDTATTEIYTLSLHDALPISTSSATTRSAPDSKCFTMSSMRSGEWTKSAWRVMRSEEHTSELQSQSNLVCRLLLEKKKKKKIKDENICLEAESESEVRIVSHD